MAGWSQEQTDKLVKLFNERVSYGVIAARLGKTRNAISGKVDRLRDAGALNEAAVQHRIHGSKGGHSPRQPVTRKLRTNLMSGKKMAPVHLRKGLKRSPIPMPQSEDIARVTFAELEPHHCRFICCAEAGKAVAAGDKLYCGLQQVPGSSYCEGHLARVSPQATVLTEKRQAWLNGDRLGARFAPEAPEEMPA
jgi:hypothetical protein